VEPDSGASDFSAGLGWASCWCGTSQSDGKWDLVVMLGAQSLVDFDRILRHIRLILGIIASETSLLLATPRSTKARL